jgi:alanine-alpha-ketoisovalerate/valine-pyruvate aminotransferase
MIHSDRNGALLIGGKSVMLAMAREYQEHARECVRMADQADSEETRNRLLELARAWMNAALIEVEEEG